MLDFVGHHRREFRFDRRLQALLGGTRKSLTQQIEAGFPFLPAGCHMELDRVASDIVLENIRTAVPSRWTERVDALRRLVAQGVRCTLARYLEETGLELEDVYNGGKSWSDLREEAGLADRMGGPYEGKLRLACGRLLHIDDQRRLEVYRRLLQHDQSIIQVTFGVSRSSQRRGSALVTSATCAQVCSIGNGEGYRTKDCLFPPRTSCSTHGATPTRLRLGGAYTDESVGFAGVDLASDGSAPRFSKGRRVKGAVPPMASRVGPRLT